MRLQKYIAECGVASRRKAERYIQQGRVCVNGITEREMGRTIQPGMDIVCVDGQLIQPQERMVLLLFHKPYGVITTMCDPQNRVCVGDYFQAYPYRIYPVGRLDYDTSGALLLTNDGALTQRLTHPSHEIKKHYHVTLNGRIDDAAIQQIRRGVELDGQITAPARVKIIGESPIGTILRVSIHEGRNRQIRRMMEAVGYSVHRLTREGIGGLSLGALEPGMWRVLSPGERRLLDQQPDQAGHF